MDESRSIWSVNFIALGLLAVAAAAVVVASGDGVWAMPGQSPLNQTVPPRPPTPAPPPPSPNPRPPSGDSDSGGSALAPPAGADIDELPSSDRVQETEAAPVPDTVPPMSHGTDPGTEMLVGSPEDSEVRERQGGQDGALVRGASLFRTPVYPSSDLDSDLEDGTEHKKGGGTDFTAGLQSYGSCLFLLGGLVFGVVGLYLVISPRPR